MMRELVIGTRGSALALWQARAVESMLRRLLPGQPVRLEVINTTGDKNLLDPLASIGDKGLFTKELEAALVEQRIDCAVHSLKDMQSALPSGLCLAAVCRRHRPEDALVGAAGLTLDTLPHQATVATGSVRRRAQLLALRPDLNVVDVRGNVGTRLDKLYANGWDGMILAAAGLERLELEGHIAQIIPPQVMVPAVGQGALGIEARQNDDDILKALALLQDAPTRICTDAERALLHRLEGGCSVPVGAYATPDGQDIVLSAVIAARDGRGLIRSSARGAALRPDELGRMLAERMLADGGAALLAQT